MLFRPSLQGVAKLMNEQLDATAEYNIEVNREAAAYLELLRLTRCQKVILMGGFAQSERLEKYLRETLARRLGGGIELVLHKSQ